MHTDDCARRAQENKPCVIDMGKGEESTATASTAGGTGVARITTTKHAEPDPLRKDFIVEILKSAEDL